MRKIYHISPANLWQNRTPKATRNRGGAIWMHPPARPSGASVSAPSDFYKQRSIQETRMRKADDPDAQGALAALRS